MTKVSTIIFALLVFTAILIGAGSFYGDLSDNYNQTGNDNMSSYSSQTFLSSMSSTSEQELNATDGGLASMTFSDLGILVFTAPINILKSFVSSTNTLINTFISLEALGLPTWAVDLVIIAVPLIVAFAIINAIWKKEF